MRVGKSLGGKSFSSYPELIQPLKKKKKLEIHTHSKAISNCGFKNGKETGILPIRL